VDDVAAALGLLCCQFVPGTLVDQQFDERQPLRFVDRFGEQFSVTRIIESRILLIHSRAPRTCIPQTDCFGTPAAAQCDSVLPGALSTDQWLTTAKRAVGEAAAHGGVSFARERKSHRSTRSGTQGRRQYRRLPGAARPHRQKFNPPRSRPGQRLRRKTALAEERHRDIDCGFGG
jgi:hypothetical protein